MTHEITFRRTPEGQAYICTCGWATPTSRYHDPHAGPAAVRHAVRSR